MSQKSEDSAKSLAAKSQRWRTGMKSRPTHVKVPFWIEKALDPLLHPHESIHDIAFRSFRTKLGPQGWSIVVSDGKNLHGITLNTMGRPSQPEIKRALMQAREELDSALTKKQLIAKPGEFSKLTKKEDKKLGEK